MLICFAVEQETVHRIRETLPLSERVGGASDVYDSPEGQQRTECVATVQVQFVHIIVSSTRYIIIHKSSLLLSIFKCIADGQIYLKIKYFWKFFPSNPFFSQIQDQTTSIVCQKQRWCRSNETTASATKEHRVHRPWLQLQLRMFSQWTLSYHTFLTHVYWKHQSLYWYKSNVYKRHLSHCWHPEVKMVITLHIRIDSHIFLTCIYIVI